MMKNYLKFFVFCVSSVFFVSLGGRGLAQQQDLSAVCPQMASGNQQCQSGDSSCLALLKSCEQYYTQQSTSIQNDITKTSQEKKTLQNKISSLAKTIKNLDAQISQNNLVIKDLGLQINDTTDSITKTNQQISEKTIQLVNILRIIRNDDKKPVIEILLSGKELSDFFGNVNNLEILNERSASILKDVKTLEAELEAQKQSLSDEQSRLEDSVKLSQAQKQQNASTKKSQEYYLGLTEQQYQAQVAQKSVADKNAAAIQAKLFQLIGVANAPTFGQALDVAKSVGSLVGVRPAFLLAIISQESAIGRNVGQCVLTNAATGAGKKISSGVAVSKLMKPTRDVSPFLAITASLGRDPYNTPVSCPLSVGYGGAMGPAQFIPSTWNLFADRIKSEIGKAGDPWAINDSFTAAGLYLSDLGASVQNGQKESTAASRYYGGSSSYAWSVMSRATCIQSFIDSGNMSFDCQAMIF